MQKYQARSKVDILYSQNPFLTDDFDFEKLGGTIIKGETFGVKYDFNSIMHYPPFMGAKDDKRPTMILKPEWKEKCEKDPDCIIGQRHGLSKSDAIQLINCLIFLKSMKGGIT